MRTSQRHQLKQDRFAETTKETISWAVEHRRPLVGTVVFFAAAAAVVLGLLWYWNYSNIQANAELGKAMEAYNAPLRPAGAPASAEMVSFASAEERARAAHEQFEKIAGQRRHTKSGKIARYLAALTALDVGDTKGGEQELKLAADSGDKEIAALARMALAGVYRSTNRSGDAVAIYKDLIANPTSTVPKLTVELELASLYQNTNQSTEAGKIYQQIIKDSPQSMAAQVANNKLAALK